MPLNLPQQAGQSCTLGIRTIISLRTHGVAEDELNMTPPYPEIATVQASLEDFTDTEFVQQWAKSGLGCTTLYYGDALRRWPHGTPPSRWGSPAASTTTAIGPYLIM
jgi:hypothetical protein